jgi:argininosuccinate lyase
MLAAQKIISASDAARIRRGLEQVRTELDTGHFRAIPSDEDIHMAVERRLIELVGPVGGKLHTARSRNDQVALDLRLYVRDAIDQIRAAIAGLIDALLGLAEQQADTVMPGYTHLQPAQPVLFAHHLLAYVAMLERDDARLVDARTRANVCPLGSGALAGTTFAIDRHLVARLLEFPDVTQNSLDAVSDRDFIVELLAACALIGVHLSRLADEIILWSTQDVRFVELTDAFATGSSMMPQKKNPDVAELVRGKSGRLLGNLVALLTMLKGLPLTYNRDLQEDKAPLFDSVDTVRASLDIFAALVPTLRVNRERMRAAATAGYTLATELADYLADKGVPFRDAHGIVGQIVRMAIETKRGLEELRLDELQSFAPQFERDVHRWLRVDTAVARRNLPGGTAPPQVRKQLKAARKRLQQRRAT